MTTANQTIVNGIDTEALSGAIESITQDPARGRTDWAIRSVWQGGTRTDHHVDGFTIGGEHVRRPFTIRVDEPDQLCGTNAFANPQEHLLAGLNACMMVGYAAVAALMGIPMRRLEVRTTGTIDLRGFLGIDASVPNGYPGLSQTVHIEADATEEQLRTLHQTVQATSPNYYNLTRAVPTASRLVIEGR
jgi:uncharacterized OsmC-like protein